MKRFVALMVLVLTSAFCANAQEPAPAVGRGKLSGFFHYVGRHTKETYTDCKHDKLWCFYVIGVSAINAADASTTVIGQHQGFREGNLLLGPHPSTFKTVVVTTIVTQVHFTAMHALREEYTNVCERDAANPESMSSKIAKKRGISQDPHRCTVAIDLVGWVAQPYHVAEIIGNVNLLNKPKVVKK